MVPSKLGSFMILIRGVPTGTGGTSVLRFSQGYLFARSFPSRKMVREWASRHPCLGFLHWVLTSGEVRSQWSSFDMDDLPIRVPSEEGKRRQVDRPKEPVPFGLTSEDISPMDGWIPGPIRSLF
jgi:hypothetical protein